MSAIINDIYFRFRGWDSFSLFLDIWSAFRDIAHLA